MEHLRLNKSKSEAAAGPEDVLRISILQLVSSRRAAFQGPGGGGHSETLKDKPETRGGKSKQQEEEGKPSVYITA